MPKKKQPRILIVTPEITYLPDGMGNNTQRMVAKAGGLADVSATLVNTLFEMKADVHVTLPHYRNMFYVDAGNLYDKALRDYKQKLPKDRIHLAEDRIFYYQDSVYSYSATENPKIALAFQREVINNIITRVQPDIIHCNDWMTGLIPAAARRQGIPCLFTVHNIHTEKIKLADMEERGIDAAEFWMHLFYDYPPHDYHAVRDGDPVDLLASGIFAAHHINTVSPRFLEEITWGWHDMVPGAVRHEIREKCHADCANGILNAPDPSFNPETDKHLAANYTEKTATTGKAANKAAFQEQVGLIQNPNAPLFFWPSRLDPAQKGPQLLAHILYDVVNHYHESGLQMAMVASGAYHGVFEEIVRFHDIQDRVAVVDFNEPQSRLGYAASDFMIMPSLFEPCGLPQMISPIYGSLPVAHNTGGIHDTITPLDADNGTGNGFLFDIYGSEGLRWCIDEAMQFWARPKRTRTAQIRRVMQEGRESFNHANTAAGYLEIYEKMLQRPLVG